MIWYRVGPDNTRATEFILPSLHGLGRDHLFGWDRRRDEQRRPLAGVAARHLLSSAVRGMGMFTHNMGAYLNPLVLSDTRSFLLVAVDHLGQVA